MTLWLVRAGEHGDQEQGVLDNKIVAIGWNKLPDLSSIQDKEKLEEVYVKFYGSEKKKTAANRVGQIWRFLKNIKKGDLVALPLKTQSSIAIGE